MFQLPFPDIRPAIPGLATVRRIAQRPRWLIAGLLLCLFAGTASQADVLRPQSDAEVVETLPRAVGERADERRLRQRWAARPGDPVLAVALARHYLAQARALGDPRFAGRALAVLQHWPVLDQAPTEVVLMSATLQQHLHDFEGSARLLESLVGRDPALAQAWLTLATVRRVQGRYDASDAACRALRAAPGGQFHGEACEAENAGLRGDFAAARRRLDALLARPQLAAASQAWLLTTLADLETRAGRRAQAEAAYRAALATEPDDYARLAYADFLLANGRPAEVAPLLRAQPRSDGLLLRLAIAGKQVPSAQAQADIAELRSRSAQAALRPQARSQHAREQALFALHVDGQPAPALALARQNLEWQREPIDLLLLAQAARAARDEAALAEVRQIRNSMGLRDERLEALL